MGSVTVSSALRYPGSGDAPNVPQDIQNLAADLDAKVCPAFASTSLRDSTIVSPAQGQRCTVVGIEYVYRATSWWLGVDSGVLAGATVQFVFNPASGVVSPSSGTATWIASVGTIAVPFWATRAYVSWVMAGIYATTTGTSNTTVKFGIGGATGPSARLLSDPGTPFRFNHVVHDVLSVSPGSYGMPIIATWASGSTYTADAVTRISGMVIFSA